MLISGILRCLPRISPRLNRDYDSMERILKIREGVDFFMELNPEEGEKSAIRAVATDFGKDAEYIQNELTTLSNIEQYLNAIGRPKEWWCAEGLTEVFTEIGPLRQAMENNAVSFDDRSKLLRSIFEITKNGKADHQLLRNIRTAIGTVTRKKNVRRMPTVVNVLLKAAPSSSELRNPKNNVTIVQTTDLVDRFSSYFEANKEQEAPLTKAQRAESNLQKLVDILPNTEQLDDKKDEIVKSLTNSIELADKAKKIIAIK